MDPVSDDLTPRERRDFAELMKALGNVRIQFWICPVEGHSDRRGTNGELVGTVDWVGDVAHCTFPGCGRTSADGRGDDDAAQDGHPGTGQGET